MHQIGLRFEQRYGVGQILQPFGTPAGGVASGSQLLMEKVDGTDDTNRCVVDNDLQCALDRSGKIRIIGELHRRTVRCHPILRMLE